MRIQHTALGAVDATIDGGKTWVLIGRVARPAARCATDSSSQDALLERADAGEALLGVGKDRSLRILPDSLQNRTARSAITVVPPTALRAVADLLPAAKTRLMQWVANRPIELFAGYEPSDGDTLLLVAPGDHTASAQAVTALRKAAADARALALARLRDARRKPTQGILTVSARIPPAEQPAMVVFLLDGNPVALQNRGPFTVRWDTRDWQDGEHLIEVRALDAAGATITRSKSLVYVENASGSTPQQQS